MFMSLSLSLSLSSDYFSFISLQKIIYYDGQVTIFAEKNTTFVYSMPLHLGPFEGFC